MKIGVIILLGLILAGCAKELPPELMTPEIPSPELPSSEVPVLELENKTNTPAPIVPKPVAIKETPPTWWKPTPTTSWQWQLMETINTKYDVAMYDIDLFDTSKETIQTIQNQGSKVICYFSAGSYEDWRSDEADFPEEVLGNTLEGWEDEKWLDVSKLSSLAPIMQKRLDLAVEKGCDGVEPDNVDGYLNDNGFSLTAQDQLAYNKWLAQEAHKRNLAIGLKNDLDQIPELVNDFDFAVNEQCFEYDECESLLPFINQNKAVFGVEYELEPDEFCEQANSMKFSWLKMDYDLDGGRIGC